MSALVLYSTLSPHPHVASIFLQLFSCDDAVVVTIQ